MRTRAGFGMALEAERRPVSAGNTLQRAVEQRAMGRLYMGGKRGFVNRKAMILAADHHPPGVQIDHRVIAAMMAEFHFYGASAAGQPEQLMTEADPEQRH